MVLPLHIFEERYKQMISECLAEKHHLNQWRFFPLHHKRSLLNGMLRHIVIDEVSVGRQAWAEIRIEMIAHLLKDRP
jgi:hypothetical protein